MFHRVSQSWQLTKQSWSVLQSDRQLLVLPLLSAVGVVVALTLTFVPAGFIAHSFGLFEFIESTSSARSAGAAEPEMPPELSVIGFVALFIAYFLSFTVVTFFNTALVACAMARFNGEDTSLRAGLGLAVRRLPQILAWSAVNATVGMILEMLKERAGWLGRIVLSLIGFAWNIAAFFAVPVLVIDGVGPIETLKRSAKVLTKTWGQSVVAQVGVSLVMGLLAMLAFVGVACGGVALGVAVGSAWLGAGLFLIGLVLTVGIMLVSATLKQILIAACYRYASTGLIPEHFDGSTLRTMFAPKGK